MEERRQAPAARRTTHETRIHGRVLKDPYHWLRERGNPEVMAYLEAENEYTRCRTAHTAELRQELYREMLGRIKEDDSTVPWFEDGYYYYSRTERGKQYSIYCRRQGSLQAPEQVILDCNELARGNDYFDLGVFEVSPGGRWLAYSVDTSGNEHYVLKIKEIDTGRETDHVVGNTSVSAAWAEDGRTLFYTTLDEIVRPYRVYRHVVGTGHGEDVLVYEESDERYHVSVGKSHSRKFIFIGSTCSTSTEFGYIPADDPERRLSVLFPRRNDVRYYPEHHGGRFLVLTNDGAKDFRLDALPIDDFHSSRPATLIPHREGVRIDFVLPFERYIVSFERDHGLDMIRILDTVSGETHDVEMPDEVYAVSAAENPDYASSTLRFSYSSPVRPLSVFDYDMKLRERRLLKTREIPSGHNPDDYHTERIHARSHDGVMVPITLLYRKGLKRDGGNPCLLYGYGAYGIPIEPSFRSTVYDFVDRGFVWAVAHVRGGGLLGETWYEDGKLLRKKNTFEDFIAAAEHLVKEGYTRPDRLACRGGSAGGLLIGAVLNMRPDLFKVAVAEVPFVDVINTMLDETIPLTVTEYDEWGNPHDEEYFEYMYSYAPYEQVREAEYPHLLVMAGLNDPRVQYWEPAKWTARLRSMKTGDNDLLLQTNMGAGHGGASGRYEYLKELAFVQAFILDHLGFSK